MTACRVLRTVRVAGVSPYGREIVAGTEDDVPADLVCALEAEGYVTAIEVDAPSQARQRRAKRDADE